MGTMGKKGHDLRNTSYVLQQSISLVKWNALAAGLSQLRAERPILQNDHQLQG